MLESLNLDVALPELILACGAMALLMLGVFTRARAGRARALARGAPPRRWPAFSWRRGNGTATLFGDSFIVDPFARVLEAADADRRGRGAAHVDRLLAQGRGG